ncbi:ferredoxin reductase family protein [Nocardioides stalactiti]|uniref:ferredoxin reductase family protein n=1 Tax=Nocardioides stalactiti TaxID=2755356 RepID=UPI0016013BE4|nr:ferredoxin reductase family protein [Nocardioides stalactiti]
MTVTTMGRATDPRLGRTARVDSWVRLLSSGVLASAMSLVTWWWIGGGGLSDLSGWATALVSTGRITGFLASVLLLAQVALMARIPVLERAFGQDRLTAIHRVIGFTSFSLMTAHIALITWGYAGGAVPQIPHTAWSFTTEYPGMLLAVAGTGCLVMVVGTSVRAARRRLRYESWHLLHLYAYLGAGLALPHQLWTGAEMTSSTSRTIFWWGAWIAAITAVLVYRVALPIVSNLRFRLRVTEVVRESRDLVSIHVAGRRLDRLNVRPGQFLSWRFGGRPGWTRANPFSLSSAPDGSSLRITVQAVGDGSSSLAALRPGTRVFVEGPFGRLTDRVRTRRKVALIGAGAGLAPLRALAEGLPYAPGDAVLIERYSDEPLFQDELLELSRTRGLQMLRSRGRRRSHDSWIGDGLVGARGHVDDGAADRDLLRECVPDIAERDVYLCGPAGWVDLVVADLDRLGVPRRHVHVESFGW